MNPVVEHFFDPNTFTFSYVVFDEKTKQAVIIDPVFPTPHLAVAQDDAVNTARVKFHVA